MTAKERMEKLAEKYFLCEPLLFAIYCTHSLEENPNIAMPMRCGNRRIEYNPNLVEQISEMELEQIFKTELLRILLKHPYSRRPEPFNPQTAIKASDSVIKDGVAGLLGLEEGKSFEEYYWKLYEEIPQMPNGTVGTGIIVDGNETGTENNSDGESCDDVCGCNKSACDATELWDDDPLVCEDVNAKIAGCPANGWGSISEEFQDIIKASTCVEIDYRKILRRFRASIISQKRRLTRMKPNRRTDFDYMGSTFDFCTKLLLAVDTSGSVTDASLSNFFAVINRLFKYGIKEVDVLYFDRELQDKTIPIKKAKSEFKIRGRGGTNFQPAFDYVEKHGEYDGIIMFTDGYAEPPKVEKRMNTKVAWVCTDKQAWEYGHEWMEKTGLSCWMKKGMH